MGEPPSLEDGLRAVVGAARDLFAVTGAGFMLMGPGGDLRYVGATDEAARALESAQEDLGLGPCVDCVILGEPLSTVDLRADDRWPQLAARLDHLPVRAVLGMPTRLSGQPVGSLNVFRDVPYDWDGSDREALGTLNGVLEGLLGRAVAARRDELIVGQLQTALDRRVVIERAVGALMERHGTSAVAAFTALRRAARQDRLPVAQIAAEVLEGADVIVGTPPPAG